MTPKRYLLKIHDSEVYVEQLESALRELRYYSIPAINYSEKVQQSPQSESPQSKLIERLDKLERKYTQAITKYLLLKADTIWKLQNLSRREYTDVLYKRYVDNKQLEVVAVEMGYSYDHTKHLHGYALAEFGEKYLKKET